MGTWQEGPVLMGGSDPSGLSPYPSFSPQSHVTLETPEMIRVLRLVGVFLAARPLGSVSWRIAVSATGSKPLERWLSPAGGVQRMDNLTPPWLLGPTQNGFLTLGPPCPLTPTLPDPPLTAAAVGGAAGAAALTQHSCRLLGHLHLGRGAGGGVWWVGEGQ